MKKFTTLLLLAFFSLLASAQAESNTLLLSKALKQNEKL